MLRRARVVACVVLLAACGPPIGVKHLGLRAAHEELTGNVLTAGRPSTASQIELQKRGLAERYTKDPAGTLQVLYDELAATPTHHDLRFAAAELSFDHAIHGGGSSYYLAAVVEAWRYLFGADGAGLDPLDPRSRLAADLYNVGLARAFEPNEKREVVLQGGTRQLPFGRIDVAFDPNTLRWGNRRLAHFTAAAELSVHGLRNRYRTWGIGAPLNASTEPLASADGAAQSFIFPKIRVPVTLLLRPQNGTGAGTSRDIRARLEVLADRQTVDVDGRAVPLEYEPTSALAQALGETNPWSLELSGFLGGDLLARRKVTRLGALAPYDPDKIPVVLVHGTASSAARWAEMLNDLGNDPAVREHFQFWLFSYDTGNPILYSAMQLRDALKTIVHEVDPRGQNECLRQMVVIGHSQGGLLTKLMVVESGDRFWRNVSNEPFETVAMPPSNRTLLRNGLFTEPLPFVTEVIFISTPHGGSYLAGGFVRNLLARLVNFPSDLARTGTDLLTGSDAGKLSRQLNRLPTSVDNMAPGSPFVTALASLPVAPGVSTHSIIPVLGDGPLEEGKDGVVAYTSAHIEPCDSELVVRNCGHSTQGDPRTIEEVRRILVEHAARVFTGDVCRAPAVAP